jgi:hypothetical protein
VRRRGGLAGRQPTAGALRRRHVQTAHFGESGPLFLLIPIGPLMMLAHAGHLKPGDLAPDFRLAEAAQHRDRAIGVVSRPETSGADFRQYT